MIRELNEIEANKRKSREIERTLKGNWKEIARKLKEIERQLKGN